MAPPGLYPIGYLRNWFIFAGAPPNTNRGELRNSATMTTFTRVEDCITSRRICLVEQSPTATRHLSLLVVEPDPCSALLLEQALFAAGVRVPAAFVDTPQEAIAYLRGDPPYNSCSGAPSPTLLLLNWHLPNPGAEAVLEWLQSRAELSRLLVVILCCPAKAAEVYRAYALGADSCLLMPADPADLPDLARHLRNYWLDNSSLMAGQLE